VAREAHYYFGVDADLPDDQLAAVVARYPAFRVVYDRPDQAPR